MENRTTIQNNFLIYSTPNNEVRVDVLLQNEMLWLSQKAMSLLFGCSSDNVSLHLKNIFESNELEENSVTEIFSATAADGTNYKVKHFDCILPKKRCFSLHFKGF